MLTYKQLSANLPGSMLAAYRRRDSASLNHSITGITLLNTDKFRR